VKLKSRPYSYNKAWITNKPVYIAIQFTCYENRQHRVTYNEQVKVGMQKALKCCGILQLKDLWLKQVDETEDVCV